MILTFTPNPCVDKTLFFESVELGGRPRTERYTCIPGGKGCNVARAVKALGHAATAMVIVGGPPGQHVVQMIEQEDALPCVPCWVAGMTRTITTVLETSIHRQTAFFEPGPAVTPAERRQLVETFRQAVAGASVVTLNGTVPDPSLRDLYAELIPLAKAAGAITIQDTHGEELRHGLAAAPDMIKPNREEAAQYLGHPLDSDGALADAMDTFHARGVRLVVISLGEDGLAVSRDGHRLRARAPQIQEVNPVGSGDSLVAAFAVGLQEDWPLEQMARWGVAAGTANAMSWDIGHFTLAEVAALVAKVQVDSI